MLCWFYCISFAKFLYFAIAPVLFVFALFALKRGVCMGRRGLRLTAFLLMFAAALKFFLFDVRMLNREVLCGFGADYCNARWFTATELAGIVLLAAASLALFHYYRFFMAEAKPSHVTPEKVNLPFWSKLAFSCVLLMVVWQLAPWVGYLTVGYIPKVFLALPWQTLAMLNLCLLLNGFWKAESCLWDYETARKGKMTHLQKSWTAKDTLWMAAFIYLITLALSYVAHDILSKGTTISG